MALKIVDTGLVRVKVIAESKANSKPMSRPEGSDAYTLRPFRRIGVTLGDYRVRRGWPVEPPRIDVKIESHVSVTGIIVQERPGPLDLQTGATIRWVADPDYFDAITGEWSAVTGAEYGFLWRSLPQFQPTLVPDVPYYVGKELFRADGISFNADARQHMFANLGAMGGSTGYTILAAMVLNSSYGTNAQREKVGLWAPGGAPIDLDEDWEETETGPEVLIENGMLTVRPQLTGGGQGLATRDANGASRVVYIAAVVGHPLSTVYVSFGPSHIDYQSLYMGEAAEPSRNVALGRSKGSLAHTADMTIMDLNVYAEPLTFNEMKEKIAILSQTYGG